MSTERRRTRSLVACAMAALIGGSLAGPAGAAARRSTEHGHRRPTPRRTHHPKTAMLTVIAGMRGQHGLVSPGRATKTHLEEPLGVAVNKAGDVYIADVANAVIEEVTPSGRLSIVAGIPGHPGASSPGRATATELACPDAVAVDNAGNVYFSVVNPLSQAGVGLVNELSIEKVTPAGNLSIVANVAPPPLGPWPSTPQLFFIDSGDQFWSPTQCSNHPVKGVSWNLDQVAAGPNDSLYITGDHLEAISEVAGDVLASGAVAQVTSTGSVLIVAGGGQSQFITGSAPATAIDLDYNLGGPAMSAAGNLYIPSGAGLLKRAPSGALTIVSGQGPTVPPMPPTPPAPASQVGILGAADAAVDRSGDIYLSDYLFNAIYKITPHGLLSVVAGTMNDEGSSWPSPTPHPALGSRLKQPRGLAVDTAGNLYIADPGNGVVEKVTNP